MAAYPWTSQDLMQALEIPVDVADQLETALAEAGLATPLDDDRWQMPPGVREQLLIGLIKSGQLADARSIVDVWRSRATQAGDFALMACCHEYYSMLLLLLGQQAGAIGELYCCLTLWQLAGNLEGIARTSWSLGAYAARQGERQALPLLSQATMLAENLGLPQAGRYRERLLAFKSSLDEPLASTP